MSYLAFGGPVVHVRHVRPCPGTARSGPSSTIFCLPTLPQRGISVASSVSVAQQWTRLRGPYLSQIGLVDRERIPVRVRHRVEVVQVAEEFVEAVQRRQELVQVAEVVLAELAGRVALRLERGGERAGLGRHADIGAGLADGRQAGAQRDLAGDEVRPARRATRLGVVVGEQHALRRPACRGSASCRT